MERIVDRWLDTVEALVPLADKVVLEVGSGDGVRSAAIAKRCRTLMGIEPQQKLVEQARLLNIRNASFAVGTSELLRTVQPRLADVVCFPLSFHHLPLGEMPLAINHALRAIHMKGRIIFLEPTNSGSFYDAERTFNACDGDEREAKSLAYMSMCTHRGITLVAELSDTTAFTVMSIDDFIVAMVPKQGEFKNLHLLPRFLEMRNYQLTANRRINIYRPA